jgi:hypothetical protein
MDTTENFSVRFDAVADNTAVAVGANRRERMDCALEAIKDVALSADDNFKRLVIFVPANFAFSHTQFVRERRGQWRCLISYKRKFQRAFSPNSRSASQRAPEILLVLNDAESYDWSPSLRVGAVVHANTRCHRDRAHYR